ncbi:MAG: nucleotidyltransferase family protein [Blautia sp.]
MKNLCTDSSDPVTLTGVDASALYRLAEKHCSLPFLLPYFENQPQFSALKQQTKQMLLSYYQLEHFTSLTFLLLLAEKIPCFLLKGISLAANYPVPEYRKLGDLNLYINEKEAFSRACRILEAHGCVEEPEDSDHHVTYRYTFPDTRTVPSRWSCTTASSASISLPVRMSWWTRFSPRII